MNIHYFPELAFVILATLVTLGHYSARVSAEECVVTSATCSMPSVVKLQSEEQQLPSMVVSSSTANPNANSIVAEGVELPGSRVVDGIRLVRNGHGLRSITYFGIGIRIYVAAMYSATPILSVEQALGNLSQEDDNDRPASGSIDAEDHNGPLQLDFTFLRYVSRSRVVSAWTQQLDHSVTHRDYDGYEADREAFIRLASGGPIENHGTQSVQLVGDETRIIDQGKVTGIIRGKNFQRAFLSIWFGSMAVAEDLKANLLKGDEHHPDTIQQVREELEHGVRHILVEA